MNFLIPKMSFPIDKLQLVPLFLDIDELKKTKAASTAKMALSKVSAAYHELFLPSPTDDRPYTFASMVLSMDGKMAFTDNPQGPVVASANYIDRDGGLADFWVLNVLRAHADAIIVGAKTLCAEPQAVFSCFDPDLAAERETNLGKSNPYPISIIVSLDGTDIPFDHTIFSTSEIQTLIATSRKGGQFLFEQHPENTLLIGPFLASGEVDAGQILVQLKAGFDAHKKVVLMTGETTPDSRVLLYILRKIGIEHLLVESPTYMWLLMSQQMLDEFFIN